MENAIILIVLAIIIGAAIAYIVRAKKKGVACIGCPAGSQCAHAHSGGSSCGCGGYNKDKKECCGCHTESK